MTFTPKKVDIDRIKDISEKSLMEIKDDIELFKTFDDNIGTGIILDARKYIEGLMRIKYANTADVNSPFESALPVWTDKISPMMAYSSADATIPSW